MTDYRKAIKQARANLLPFESWEQLPGESKAAFSAFCAFRDLRLERTIHKAVESVAKDKVTQNKKYNVWRTWSDQFKWRERAEDFDKSIERLKQSELRKTFEPQIVNFVAITGIKFDVINQEREVVGW